MAAGTQQLQINEAMLAAANISAQADHLRSEVRGGSVGTVGSSNVAPSFWVMLWIFMDEMFKMQDKLEIFNQDSRYTQRILKIGVKKTVVV